MFLIKQKGKNCFAQNAFVCTSDENKTYKCVNEVKLVQYVLKLFFLLKKAMKNVFICVPFIFQCKTELKFS